VPFTKIFCSPNGILTVFTIVASTFMWSILDPTLEPHLRKVGVPIYCHVSFIWLLKSSHVILVVSKVQSRGGLI
jgi:hypothetical protein